MTISSLPPPLVTERAAPSMLAYSILFALVFIGGALVVGLLVETYAPNPKANFSSVGHMLALLGAVFTGWIFVKRRKRLFSVSENRRIVAFCVMWVFLVEGIGLWANAEMFRSLPAVVLGGVFVFSLGVQGIIVWASFRYVVRKFMSKRVAGDTGNAV